MATNLGTLSVILDAETKEFTSKMEGIKKSLKKFGEGLQKAALASGVGFAGATLAMKRWTDAARVQEQAERKLSAAIQASGKAINIDKLKAYASELQNVTTFGDEATLETMSLLTAYGLSEDAILKLTPRIQDYVALTGRSMAESTRGLAKSLKLGAGSLNEYGVTMTKAQAATFNAATEADKLTILLGRLDEKAGGAAKALADTATGALDQFANASGDLEEQLGLLVATGLVPFLQDMKPLVEDAISFFAGLSDETKSLAGKGAILSTALLGITAAAGGMVVAFQSLYPIAAAVSAPLVGIAAVVAGVIATVGALSLAFDDLGKDTQTNMKLMGKAMGADLVGMWDFAVENIIRGAAFIRELWQETKDLLTGGDSERNIDDLVLAAEAAVQKFKSGKSGIGEAISGDLLKGIKAAMAEGVKVIQDALMGPSMDFGGLGEEIAFTVEEGVKKGLAAGAAGGMNVSADQFNPFEAMAQTAGPVSKDVTTAFESDEMKFFTEQLEAGGKQLEDNNYQMSVSSIAAENFSADMGSAGEMVSSGVQGFAQGGPMGAAAAVFMTFISKLEIVTSLFEVFSAVIDGLIHVINMALKPITNAFKSATKSIGKFFGVIDEQLADIDIGLGVGYGVNASAEVAIEDLLTRLATSSGDFIDNLGSEVLNNPAVMEGLQGKLKDQIATTQEEIARILLSHATNANDLGNQRRFEYELGLAEEELAGLTTALSALEEMTTVQAVAAEEAAEAIKDVTSSLTNVPEGFKIARARLEAANPDYPTLGTAALGVATGAVAGAGDGSGSGTINIETVNVVSDDLPTLAGQIRDGAIWAESNNTTNQAPSTHNINPYNLGGNRRRGWSNSI